MLLIKSAVCYRQPRRNGSISAASGDGFEHHRWIYIRYFHIIALAFVLATASILFGAFAYAFYYERVIPYSEELVKIEKDNNNQLVSRYYGKSYTTVHETHPMLLEVDGERKNIRFIFYTKTMTDGPSRNLIDTEKISVDTGYASNIVESEKVDAVYYANFDTKKSLREQRRGTKY